MTFSQAVVARTSQSPNMHGVILSNYAVLLTVRTYALYNRSRTVAILLLTVLIIGGGVSAVRVLFPIATRRCTTQMTYWPTYLVGDQSNCVRGIRIFRRSRRLLRRVRCGAFKVAVSFLVEIGLRKRSST